MLNIEFYIKDKNIFNAKKFLNKTIVIYITIIFMMGTVPSLVRSDPNDPWWNQDWIYRKEINIDHSKVDANLIDFPVLINLPSDTDLAAHAQSDGDDIVFTDIQGEKLNHEIELYTSATGRLVAWVNVTSLSSTTNTRLYIYYGNNICSSQQNPPGTWDANYLFVHHMNEIGTIYDSTSHGYSATNSGTTTEPNGKIDGCRYFDSTTDRYDFGTAIGLNPGMNSWTISLWTKITHVDAYQMLRKYGSAKGFTIYLYNYPGSTTKHNYIKVSDGVKSPYRYWDTSWSDGNWHYINAVINRNTNQIDVYLDGTLHNGLGYLDLAGVGSITTTANFLLYGGTNGRHDEFTISTTVRNSSWIKTSYNNQNDSASFYNLGGQEQLPGFNLAPVFSYESPQDGTEKINVNRLSVNVTIEDPEGNPFDWTIEGPYVISASQTGDTNGTKIAQLIAPLPPYTNIVWYVNATDPSGSGKWNNATFYFSTNTDLPTIFLNFAGNPSDSGGPYYLPGTNIPAPEGYYTNTSYQQEKWIYINCTATDNVGIDKVWLHWLNGTQWTNNSYQLTHTTGDYYEINLSVDIAPGPMYSFDFLAVNIIGKSTLYQWLKIGADTTLVDDRRYIQLAGTPTNVSYVPYYFYPAQYKYTTGYGPGHNMSNDDILHHDQGPDGTLSDTGYLYTPLPTNVMQERNCLMYVGYWFDETITALPGTLQNIYHHFWWNNNNHNLTVAYGKTDAGFYRTEDWGQFYLTNTTKSHSNISYNNKIYYLESAIMKITSSQSFTDNDIYEFFVEYYSPTTTNPTVINNRSILSYVIFNIPDNTTLQGKDTDSDGLTDYLELFVTYTNPFIQDTDNDHYSDYLEYIFGSDPNNYQNILEIAIPTLTMEHPVTGSIGQQLNPRLIITINHPLNRTMNLTFQTNASGIWQIIGTNLSVHNGSYSQNPTIMNSYNTTFYWSVNCSDGIFWTNKTYSFTTKQTPSPWWNPEWIYRKEIWINNTKIESHLLNFPTLINLASDTNLALHAQPDGDDIVFIDASGNKLNHEIELYESATGRLIAWVNITSLSSTTENRIYIYYGNNLCSSQQNPPGTWDANYLFVHHMNETGTIYDSTSHGYNAANIGTTTEPNGKIDGCRYFDATTDRYDFGTATGLNPGMNSWTISLWTKITHVDAYQMLRKYGSAAGFTIYLYNGGGTTKHNYIKVSDGVNSPYRYWDTSWSDGNWHYINAVINRNTNKIDVYLDGTIHNGFASGDLTSMGSITTTANFLLYGGTNGRHDEFTISTTVRNSSWIKTSYNNQNNPSSFYNISIEERASSGNQVPILSNPIPQNELINVSIYQEKVSITIRDSEGNPFDWTIKGKYIVTTSQTGDSNGTKTANLVQPLPAGTNIIWYVNVTDKTGSGKWSNATYSFITESLTPTLKWSHFLGLGNYSAVSPLIADVNLDGKMEVIRSGTDGITIFDGATGNIVWKRVLNIWNDHCPIEVIDLNKDKIPEIICNNDTGTIAIHGNNGSTYWYNPDAPLYNKYPVAGDINADGYPEVYVCTHGQITALTHDGQIFATAWTYYPCFSGLSLGDTNQDGVFELYLNERGRVYSIEGEGVKAYWASNLTKRWSYPSITCSSHTPTLVDVNKDGILEVVSCDQNGYGGIAVLNSMTGAVMKAQLDIPGMYCHSQPTICDTDGDGTLELIACRDFYKPVIWNLSLTNWKQDAVLPYGCLEPPAVADVTGDGKVEILACQENNISIYTYDKTTSKYIVIGTIPLTNPGYYGMAFIIAQDVDNDGLNELILNRAGTVYVYDTIAKAPNPRASTEFDFYSQHRGRSPYYVPYGPLNPIVKDENPINKTTNQPRNPSLSMYIYDYQHNLMNITFRTNSSTGQWHDIKNEYNVSDGTYVANPTEMGLANTNYWWRVNITDSTGRKTSKLYKFTTAKRHLISNPTPLDGATNIEPNPMLSAYVEDIFGDSINLNFMTNASGSWEIIGSNMSVGNGTYSQKPTTMTMFNTTYYWRVCCFGGGIWTNKTFRFTSYKPSSAAWWNGQWMYRSVIKIDHTKISTNLKNFPVLISLTSNANLAAHSQSDGDDIVFTDFQGNKLNHEIELYTGVTGRLIAWVNVTNLSFTTDTQLFLYYGNSLCSSQQNPSGTWNADYLFVHHMNETGTIYDSTSHGYNAINYGTTADSNGKIDGNRYFDSTTDRYDFGTATGLNPGMNSWTISLWTKITYVNAYQILRKFGTGAGFTLYLYNGWGGNNYFKVSDGVKTAYRYWNTSWSDGNWHYINAVINRNTNTIDLYLDGVLHNGGAEQNLVGMGSITTTASFLLYGGTNGRHDEFSISTTVRNSSWIKTCYNNQNNPSDFSQIFAEETRPNVPPSVSNEEPENGSSDISLYPTLHITVFDTLGYLMNITWETNASGNWTIIGTNSSVGNGLYFCSATDWVDTYDTTYWWKVRVNNGHGFWNNKTYSFTTMNEPNLPPTQNTPLLVSEFGGNTTDENLICSNQSTTDPNGDAVYNTYHWLRNGTSLTNLLLSFNTQNQTTAKDYSGYHNNGSITGAIWNPNGVIGGSYDFYGIDSQDYITIPDSSTLDGDGTWTEMTMECWVKSTENYQSATTIIGKWRTSTQRSYQLGFASNGNSQLFTAVLTANGLLETQYSDVNSLVTGTWYHVAATYKNGLLKLYINGSLVTSQSNSGGAIHGSTMPLRIGCHDTSGSGVGGFFSGSIDEPKIYPFALSAEQIYQNYLQSKDGVSSHSTIVAEETNIGDIWQCEVTPSDGQLDGLTNTSNSLTLSS